MKNPFYILDVFAEEKYSGNRLAVVRGAASISDDEMLAIARETNFSETAFILSDEERDGAYDLRIFTPKEEISFAGHPTLGTAYVIQQEIIQEPVDLLVLNLKIGRIPVSLGYKGDKPDIIRMKQMQPVFGETIEPEAISEVLGLESDDIYSIHPVQAVSTGFPFIIVPLKGKSAMKRCRVNKERYFKLIEEREAKAILVFSPDAYDQKNNLNVRVFADYYGIPEDPATGSANGCLGAYLVNHDYCGSSKISISV